MKLTGNTILITGGGTGIGRGLAEAFHALGNAVVIAGRREKVLREVVAAHAGMEYVVFDQDNAEETQAIAETMRTRFPKLNVLINNAGVQRVEDLTSGQMADAEMTIQTNLLGPMRLTAALIRQLMDQPEGAILNVTSALAMLPAAMLPSYCASKAAMHSYTQSLRFQLRNTGVQVIEIIPPWVQTELQGERGMNPKAMPLPEYIVETITLLKDQPEATEIVSERGKLMRFAERGDYDAFFQRYNSGWMDTQR
ncbi:SDR family oxidoreductase [Silvibacterium sp.]|uniref:SDR family oxidoreductase n=1 Tax=Silvibacterium sp. TaxID=1964179 RepID=UPI0039E4A47F